MYQIRYNQLRITHRSSKQIYVFNSVLIAYEDCITNSNKGNIKYDRTIVYSSKYYLI